MTKSDKIIIGSTVIVTASAIAMFAISKKYEAINNEIQTELQDINYILSRSREDIIVGNKEIVEGNRILRSLIKQDLEEKSK